VGQTLTQRLGGFVGVDPEILLGSQVVEHGLRIVGKALPQLVERLHEEPDANPRPSRKSDGGLQRLHLADMGCLINHEQQWIAFRRHAARGDSEQAAEDDPLIGRPDHQLLAGDDQVDRRRTAAQLPRVERGAFRAVGDQRRVEDIRMPLRG